MKDDVGDWWLNYSITFKFYPPRKVLFCFNLSQRDFLFRVFIKKVPGDKFATQASSIYKISLLIDRSL